MTEPVLGVLLAGGRSSRMGQDKADVVVAGKTMAEWTVAALNAFCDDVVAVGRTGELAGVVCLPDPMDRYRGPLAGLVAGCRYAKSGTVVLLAVDQPWARPSTLAALARRAVDRPVVPVADGSRQTTCAAYPLGVLDVAESELSADGSIQSMLDRTSFDPIVDSEWTTWGEDGRSWFSADTPAATLEGLRRFGSPA